jgi:hypothetical protein
LAQLSFSPVKLIWHLFKLVEIDDPFWISGQSCIIQWIFNAKSNFEWNLNSANGARLMIYPLDSRNTKKLKNQKPKLLIFL